MNIVLKETNDKPTPLPVWQVVTVLFVQICESLNINVLFPFLAFMVEDFGYTGDRLGYYAGLLAASFCAAQFSSSIMWGVLSDKFGRKPIIILGVIGTACGMLTFGLSKTFTHAVVGRMISGFLSGNLGVIKSFLTEITDDSNRGTGFSYMSLAWAIGTVLAPLAGGMLCKPADKYPDLFSADGIFGVYPYLLPCLLCVFFNVTSAVVVAVCMRDPKADELFVRLLRGNGTGSGTGSVRDMVYESLPTESEHGFHLEIESGNENGDGNGDDVVGRSTVGWNSSCSNDAGNGYGRMDNASTSTSTMTENDDDNDDDDELVVIELGGGQSQSQSEDERGRRQGSQSQSQSCSSSYSSTSSSWSSSCCCSLLCCIPPTTCCSYGMLCMAYILYDETVPLFLKQDKMTGGFGFTSGEIGFVLSVSGVAMLLFTLLLLPSIAARSKVWNLRMAIWAAMPLALAWPVLGRIHGPVLRQLPVSESTRYVLRMVMVIVTCVLKFVLSCIAFTSSMILINHSVSDEHLGKANGLGQCFASFARAIGPALGGALWSLGVAYSFVFTNFLAVVLLLLMCLLLNARLPASLDFKKTTTETSEMSPNSPSNPSGCCSKILPFSLSRERSRSRSQSGDTSSAVSLSSDMSVDSLEFSDYCDELDLLQDINTNTNHDISCSSFP
eukprot:gene3155-6211_t